MKNKFVVLCFCLLTAACSNETKQSLKETVGIGRTSPDEFLIATNEPLKMPENFKELPVPGEVKAGATNKASAHAMAKEAFVSDGKSVLSAREEANMKKKHVKPLEVSEKAFLSEIKEGDKGIRQEIEEENSKKSGKTLFNFKNVKVIDAEKEQERLRQLKERGEKVTGKGSETTTRRESKEK